MFWSMIIIIVRAVWKMTSTSRSLFRLYQASGYPITPKPEYVAAHRPRVYPALKLLHGCASKGDEDIHSR